MSKIVVINFLQIFSSRVCYIFPLMEFIYIMRRANRAPIFLSKFNSCQLDDWIERLDKLILKVSNIFFSFFFLQCFFL